MNLSRVYPEHGAGQVQSTDLDKPSDLLLGLSSFVFWTKKEAKKISPNVFHVLNQQRLKC